MTAPTLRAFGKTDRGLIRAGNEDSFVMADLVGEAWSGEGKAAWSISSRGILLAVSDGMGGAKAGEIASALSVEKVLEGMVEAARNDRPSGETLRRVVEEASLAVYREAQRADRRGMGATLTAVLISGHEAFIAQIGDSRAYLIRDGKMGQITHDQSYVQLMVDAGVMTPAQAERSPRKNVILQVMGQETAVRVALGSVELAQGDRLLLCSDGLTNAVDDAVVRELAQPPIDIEAACEALIAETLESGAPDNVTVVLAELA